MRSRIFTGRYLRFSPSSIMFSEGSLLATSYNMKGFRRVWKSESAWWYGFSGPIGKLPE